MDHGQTTRMVLRARDGSRADLDALCGRYAQRLLAIIRLRMGPRLRARCESRDVLQNSLLKACRSIEGFEGESGETFMAWLARIARNEIRDQAAYQQAGRRDLRQDLPLDDAGETLAAEVRTATARVALGEQAAALERALEALDESQRELIVLRKLEELSFPEMGQRLGRSPDACRMAFARAMAALTLALDADG
jgi:RNA polymerase sigma-70 factor, ECF subfamily